MKYKKVLSNRAQCKLCGDVIESKHRHDFVTCSCREISVDGGLDYIRRGAQNLENIIELSEYEEIDFPWDFSDVEEVKTRKKLKDFLNID